MDWLQPLPALLVRSNSTALPLSWRKTIMSASPATSAPSSQASRSNVVSMRRRKKSTPRGRSPKIARGSARMAASGRRARDRRAGRRALHASSSTPRTARSTTSAASIARSCRTRSSSSPGPGAARRSASRSSPSLIKPDGDGTMLTLMHEQFFDEAARDRHELRLDRRARQARKAVRVS